METEGSFAPADAAAVREQYAAAETAAEAVLREFARAVPEAADRRNDADLHLTASEAIYASLLEVHVGTREEFESYLADCDRPVEEVGSEHVDNVAWHDAPAADRIVAATFASEPEAAVGTLRRQAFAKLYREVV